MSQLIGPFVSKIKKSCESTDIVDRLNYEYTTIIIVVAALTLAAKQYVGQPIQCWVPAQFTGAWESYSEMYCFIKSTYYLPLDEQISHDFSDRNKREIGYYQWVPIVLAFQAMFFYLPSLFWSVLNFQTGINVRAVLESAACVKKKLDKKTRDEKVEIAAGHLLEVLDLQRELKTGGFGPMSLGKHYGVYVCAIYLLTKLLYVVNVVVQFWTLNKFLGSQYTFWGYGILNDIVHGRSWQESGHFPRVTMCDLNVRVLGNIHRWTLQCVLMINMFNEKIYLFLWWWFLVVGILSIVSLLLKSFELISRHQTNEFVLKYLRVGGFLGNVINAKDQRQIDGFVHGLLRPDGVLLIRLIQSNGGDLLTTDIVSSLYGTHLERVEAGDDKKNNNEEAGK